MFLERLLPSEGLICVAMALKPQGFRHFFCESMDEATRQIRALEKSDATVYIAQATFKTDESRKQDNALYLRNFFLDIDCGPEKDYPSQKDAAKALKELIDTTGLPMPTVVSSGNGLYAHWLIDEMIPAQQWKTIARILKSTIAAYGFRADPSRTADSASVLRPVGATHRKDPNKPKTVRIIGSEQPATSFTKFVGKLQKAAKAKKVDTTPTSAPKPANDVNAEFYEGLDKYPDSSAALIADKCSQVGHFRDKKGDVSEPYWYAALGIVGFCADKDEVLHSWSEGHSGYDAAQTEAKVQQYLDSGVGPTTCAKFGSISPEGCIGCPHNGRIKSPIVLGRQEPKEIVEEEEPSTPERFRRAKDGLYFNNEGHWEKFYDQDLYIHQIAFDESLQYQVAIIRHCLPYEGCMEFAMRSSLVHDAKAMLTFLSDNNVHVVGAREKKVMVAYMESYISKLQRQRKMTRLLGQMGWKSDSEGNQFFVLGKKVFYADGRVSDAGLARHVPQAAEGFSSSGDPSKWVEATELLDAPGMEPYAFALLCGFAAPLIKFTGFEGAMVSLVGDSGIGKTLMMRWAQSIYGHHKKLMLLRDDTRNMLVSRLGVYGNLPLVIDEVTNIDGQELSDLVYRVTQGRDKGRLTKNAEEKKSINSWNTIALVTTNSSLVDKLSGVKYDASAEINRVFEYTTPAQKSFSGSVTAGVFWTIDNNYGHVGETFCRWLVANTDSLERGLKQVQEKIDLEAEIRGDERYWSAIAASAIYGGVIAKKLGLIRFDVGRVMRWAAQQIRTMRQSKDDLAEDAISILGQFIDQHFNNCLIVQGAAIGRGEVQVIQKPHGALVMRLESDSDKLYISRTIFKTWLAKRFGNYHKTRMELQAHGALTNANKPKTLGGTMYAGSTQPCWEVDMKCHKLGAKGIQIAYSAPAEKQAGKG